MHCRICAEEETYSFSVVLRWCLDLISAKLSCIDT